MKKETKALCTVSDISDICSGPPGDTVTMWSVDYSDATDSDRNQCCIEKPLTPHSQMEYDKRMRRQVANNNERRRMQSINLGFDALKKQLPLTGSEKLSKAMVLQNASDYIQHLLTENKRISARNSRLECLIAQLTGSSDFICSPTIPGKRRKSESLDDDLSFSESDDVYVEKLKAEIHDLKEQLNRERGLRCLATAETAPHSSNQEIKVEQVHDQGEGANTGDQSTKEETNSDSDEPSAASVAQQNLQIMFDAISHVEASHTSPPKPTSAVTSMDVKCTPPMGGIVSPPHPTAMVTARTRALSESTYVYHPFVRFNLASQSHAPLLHQAYIAQQHHVPTMRRTDVPPPQVQDTDAEMRVMSPDMEAQIARNKELSRQKNCAIPPKYFHRPEVVFRGQTSSSSTT